MESDLKKVNPKVRRYIGNEILLKYHQLKGHTDSHISDVIYRSLKIAKSLEGVNVDMVYVIAAYHDLGRLVDNETHHLESAKMLRADESLKDFFTNEEIEIMARPSKITERVSSAIRAAFMGKLFLPLTALVTSQRSWFVPMITTKLSIRILPKKKL